MESAISGKFLRLHSSCTWKCNPLTELWLCDLSDLRDELWDSWLRFGICPGRILPLSEMERSQWDARNPWTPGALACQSLPLLELE